MYESWSVSDDGLKWTFNVRKNVVSPYGNELTADDFKWHMEKIVAQGAIWNFVIGSTGLKSHEQIDVVDSHTVEFNLPVPNIVFFHTQTIYWHVFDSTEMKKHQTEDDPWSVNWLENNSAGFGRTRSPTCGRGAVGVRAEPQLLGHPGKPCPGRHPRNTRCKCADIAAGSGHH